MVLNYQDSVTLKDVTVDDAHPLPVTNVPSTLSSPAISSVTSVDDSASNQTLVVARAARKGLYIWNNSTEILYIKFGATATTSSWTIRLGAGDYYEAPSPCYTGIVDGIWANNASGSAKITEVY